MLHNFIKNLLQNNKVFVLEDKNGIAFSHSIFFKNEDGSLIPVICFWSTFEEAKKVCIQDWKHYNVTEICLVTFIEDWLIQIYNDSLIVGLNFNDKMEGFEADPLDLIAAIVKEIKQKNIKIELEYFKNIDDLDYQVKDLLRKTKNN